MTRSVLISLCLGIAASSWIIAWIFSFREGGYERGFQEGYEKGFREGERRAELWWIESDREVAEARQRIREEEEHGWRDAS
jgi:hypothetical protein